MPHQQSRTDLLFGIKSENPALRSELQHSFGGGAPVSVDRQVDGRLLSVYSAIAVAPTSVTLAVNGTRQLRVTGTAATGKTDDITALCNYVSANTAIVTVDDRGLVTGVATGGPVNVTATYKYDTTKTAVCAVTVS